MSNKSKTMMWVGIALIMVTGLIHVIDAPDSFEEAAYKGWLFCLNGAGALVAAFGIFRGRAWGWNLGFLIAAGSIVGYTLSRTVGLPQIPAEPDAWLEPLGVAAMSAEGLIVLLFFSKKMCKKCSPPAP